MSVTTTGRCIHLVMVDAWFTLFQTPDRKQLICSAYREEGRLPDDVTDDMIWGKFLDYRERFSTYRDDEKYWFNVNVNILDDLTGSEFASTRAKKARRAIMIGDAFTVQASMIDWIRALRRQGLRVVIASNTQREFLDSQLERHSIAGEFDALYTSDGLEVRKPFPDFWSEIMRREGVSDLSTAVHIGNSPNSDVGAVALGIPVILYDRARKLGGLLDGTLDGIEIPEQSEDTLREYLATGLISVVHDVPGLRDEFARIRGR
ncbi:MAG: HAD family hydrolase [bacterium]